MRFRPTALVDLGSFPDGLHVRGEGHVFGKLRHGTGRHREGLVIVNEGRKRRVVGPVGDEEDEVHAGFEHRCFAEVHEVRDRDTDSRFLEQFASGCGGEGLASLHESAGQAPISDLRSDGALHQHDGRSHPQDGDGHRLRREPLFVAVDAAERRTVDRQRLTAAAVHRLRGRDVKKLVECGMLGGHSHLSAVSDCRIWPFDDLCWNMGANV